TIGHGLAGNTPKYTASSGRNTVRVTDHIIPTISHAHEEIINCGIEMYSIYFEVSGNRMAERNARYTLDNSQNLGFYNADSQNIDQIYDEISTAINHAASGSYVVDEIGNMFEIDPGSIATSHGKTATYDDNTRQIKWDIGSIKE